MTEYERGRHAAFKEVVRLIDNIVMRIGDHDEHTISSEDTVECSRCKQISHSGHKWAYGTVASGSLCEQCFTVSNIFPKPWALTAQQPYQWMQGEEPK